MACSGSCVMNTLTGIMFIFGFPTYIFYQAVLLRNRNDTLSASFFRLLTALGWADLAQSLLLTYNQVLFAGYFRGWFEWAVPAFQNVLVYSSWSCGFVQSIGCVLLAANRFTAIVLPLKHATIWTDNMTNGLSIAAYLVSFGICLPTGIYGKRLYVYFEATETATVKAIHGSLFTYYWLFESVTLTAFALLIVGLYAAMAIKFILRAKQQKSAVEANRQAAADSAINLAMEAKLALSALAITFGLIIWAVADAVMALGLADYAVWAIPLGATLQYLCYVNPFVVGACSSILRACCLQLLGCGERQQPLSKSHKATNRRNVVATVDGAARTAPPALPVPN